MPICAIIQTTCSSAQNPWLVSNWLVSKCVCKESQKQVWGSFRDRGEAAISRHRPLWPMGNIDNTIMWKNDIECWTFLNKYRSKILHKSDEKVTSSSFQVSIFFWMITPCGLSCPMPCPRLPNPYCDAMIASEIRRSACWTLEYSYIHIYIWRWRTVINATGHLWAQRQAQTDVCFCLTLSCVHDDNVKQHWDFFFLFCLFGFLPVITHEEHVGHSEGDLEPAPVCDKVGEQRKDEETHTEEHLVQDTHCSPVLHTNNLCD